MSLYPTVVTDGISSRFDLNFSSERSIKFVIEINFQSCFSYFTTSAERKYIFDSLLSHVGFAWKLKRSK